jgi:two-component system, NarL family, sensor kinase
MTEQEIILSIILTTLLILLLLAGITISFFVVARQNAKQQFELSQARLAFEKELGKVRAEVSEQLMQQIAHELHDHIGHSIACIRLAVENKKLDHPELESVFRPIEGFVNDAAEQLRLLSRSLNTEYIAYNGLLTAIETEVSRQNQLKKFQITWEHAYDNDELDSNQSLIVFRILQEVVHNAIKHSNASRVHLALSSHPFTLEVDDDGKGFDIQQTLASSRASGLRNIIKRATMAGLECEIISAPGTGCKYRLIKQYPQGLAPHSNISYDRTKKNIIGR